MPVNQVSTDMDVLTAIRTRRSIRRYTTQQIDDRTLEVILEAGFCAPSASNKRPWHFLVIRDRDTLQAISEAHPYAKMMPSASFCVIVVGDEQLQAAVGLLVEDCSAAIQNMLLAAHGLGIGAVWCGIYGGRGDRHLEFARLMQLPPSMLPVGMIAFGYPAETKVATERFEQDRVHYEKW